MLAYQNYGKQWSHSTKAPISQPVLISLLVSMIKLSVIPGRLLLLPSLTNSSLLWLIIHHPVQHVNLHARLKLDLIMIHPSLPLNLQPKPSSRLKHQSFGPDNISKLHLKHLGPTGINYLTNMLNLSIASSEIPSIWKTSKIIPSLKAGKDPSDSKSNRPISQLSPTIKIIKRLVLPILDQHFPDNDIQHGFCRTHSTTSALLELNATVASGFNQKRPPSRTMLLQIDLSQAFDRVNHEELLVDLNNSSLPSKVVKWFNCYLKGRQSRTIFRNFQSSSRNIHTGVPKGAVTSPKLFDFHLYHLPQPPAGVKVVMYADDLSVYAMGPDIQILGDRVNSYVPTLLQFFKERDLIVSPEKSTVTLFTPQPNQSREHPRILINGTTVPLQKQPRMLVWPMIRCTLLPLTVGIRQSRLELVTTSLKP